MGLNFVQSEEGGHQAERGDSVGNTVMGELRDP